MRTTILSGAVASRAAILLAASAGVAMAQLPNASPAATGLSGAYTARARGYDAVAWNPANLGLSGNPGFSLGLLALSGSSGLDPVSLSDFAPYSGKVLPATQREEWLQRVVAKGGENGTADGGVTLVGLSAGPVAFQVASSIAGSSKLSPDGFQALMFGNAGRTGSVETLDLEGSNVRAEGFTTGAASYGFKVSKSLSLGVTAKYVVGNFVAMAQDQGSSATADAVNVNFPMVYSRPDSNIMVGSGFGMDLGMAWSSHRVSFGATVQNVFNSFAWDETKLMSKAGTALFDANTDTSNFEDQPYVNAPASLRSSVATDKFKPTVSAGIAYALSSSSTVSADVRQQMGDGIQFGPKTQAGVGLEVRTLPILRLRGGASYVTGGYGVSAGVGLALGKYELGVGGALRHINGGEAPAVTVNVLSIR
jgi:hypothetical protein